MALTWPNKDPEEVLDYPVQFSDWLVPGCDIAAGATVVQEGVSEPGGLTDIVVDAVFVVGKSIIVWLSAGTAGETYSFKIDADDTGTPVRTVIRRVKIKVKAK